MNKFVARDEDMTWLENTLLPDPGRHARRKVLVLHGPGGIGKTQLAAEFMLKHQGTFSASFWLDGSSHDTMRQSLAGVAPRLPETHLSEMSKKFKGAAEELDAVIDEVLRWFSLPKNNRWLLVVDNVDRAYPSSYHDPDAFDVEKYLPGAENGSVLITSRLSELEQLGNSHRLKGMDEKQGKALIENRAGKLLEGMRQD